MVVTLKPKKQILTPSLSLSVASLNPLCDAKSFVKDCDEPLLSPKFRLQPTKLFKRSAGFKNAENL